MAHASVPVFYHQDAEVAKKIVAACAAGGAGVVEFTNRGDLAYRVFSELVRHFAVVAPDVILGVGSVVDPGTAALYLSCGAEDYFGLAEGTKAFGEALADAGIPATVRIKPGRHDWAFWRDELPEVLTALAATTA